MFIKVRRAFTLGAVLFLLLLFTLPSLFLRQRCSQLDELCGRVLSAARAGDEAAARSAYDELTVRYEAMRKGAELFLDHKVMDDASLPLQQMGVYLKAQDRVSLEAAAVQFRLALDCMLAIETADLRLLL